MRLFLFPKLFVLSGGRFKSRHVLGSVITKVLRGLSKSAYSHTEMDSAIEINVFVTVENTLNGWNVHFTF